MDRGVHERRLDLRPVGRRHPADVDDERPVARRGNCRARARRERVRFMSWSSRFWNATETTAPRAAIAISPAIRDTALLTPLASPEWPASTELRTVAVSGATVADSPRPNTSTPGRIWVR